VAEAARGTAVVIGITGTCPYGIGACWGGAHEALLRLEGVELVNPIPNADESTAQVFLADDRWPALDRWHEQFRRIVGGRYELRGVEVSVEAVMERVGDALYLTGTERRPRVRLAPLSGTGKVQWDRAAHTPAPATDDELRAYDRLIEASSEAMSSPVIVTGPLTWSEDGYQLQVRACVLRPS